MERVFSVGENTIPVELRPLYDEVQIEFENSVYGAMKIIRRKDVEETWNIGEECNS